MREEAETKERETAEYKKPKPKFKIGQEVHSQRLNGCWGNNKGIIIDRYFDWIDPKCPEMEGDWLYDVEVNGFIEKHRPEMMLRGIEND